AQRRALSLVRFCSSVCSTRLCARRRCNHSSISSFERAMQSDNARGFLKAMSMVAIATGLAIVTINMVIDPYRRFELVTIPGVNAQRNQFPHEARMAKAEAVCRIQPTSVAMG